MTQEDIDQLEKSGCDVSELKAAQSQKEETQKKEKTIYCLPPNGIVPFLLY